MAFFNTNPNAGQINQLNKQINQHLGDINNKYTEIGRITKLKYLDNIDDPDIKRLAGEIDTMLANLQTMTKQINELKGLRECVSCRMQIGTNVAFCPNCGAKQPVAQPTVAPVQPVMQQPMQTMQPNMQPMQPNMQQPNPWAPPQPAPIPQPVMQQPIPQPIPQPVPQPIPAPVPAAAPTIPEPVAEEPVAAPVEEPVAEPVAEEKPVPEAAPAEEVKPEQPANELPPIPEYQPPEMKPLPEPMPIPEPTPIPQPVQNSPSAPQFIFCTSCGNKEVVGTRFCSECGAVLE